MKNKKGAGTVIAWVLLLGFSIGLATTVFLWSTRQTEELSEHAVKFVEGGMQCDSVGINVACEKNLDNTCKKLTVSNTRYLNIERILLRGLDSLQKDYCQGGAQLKIQQQQPPMDCDVDGWYGKIEVMPLVKVNGGLVGCKNKAVTIQCDQCKL